MAEPRAAVPGSEVAVWPAPYAQSPVDGSISLPGSKSLTNRALLLAALATGPSVLHGPLLARDTQLMMCALRALGASIAEGGDSLVVQPAMLTAPAEVHCGLAGTVLRFLPPVAGLATGPVTFMADEQAVRRPLTVLLSALRHLGVAVESPTGGLPFVVHGAGRVPGGAVTIDASASSQFVSSLLLAGARFDSGVDVQHRGDPLPSRPHIDMTVAMLAARGVSVTRPSPDRWVVAPGPIAAAVFDIEPDLSTAAPFLAAAVVTAGTVTVTNWPPSTHQPGHRLPEILARFGAAVVRQDGALTVTGPDRISALDVDLHDVGELAPVLAAVAACASGPSYLRGISHLRGHETDRLTALARELCRLGAEVSALPDGLRIDPGPLRGAVVQTYGDHRIAQAAAVLGLVVPDVAIIDVGTTAKTHPDFVSAWTELVA